MVPRRRSAVARATIGLSLIAVVLAAALGLVLIAQPASIIHPATTTLTRTLLLTTTQTLTSTGTSTSTLTTTLIATSNTTATSTTSTATTATATNRENGLELRLFLNASSSQTGANVSIFADVYNPTSSAVNVTSANDWVVPLNSSNGAPCGDEGQTVGFAVAKGYYTSSNITVAKLLDLVDPFQMYMCPLYFGYGSPTGLLFQPMSDSGASYGCIGVSPTCPTGSATATYGLTPLTVTGYWNQRGTFANFPPGTYTVLSEDEWGALALAYFRAA